MIHLYCSKTQTHGSVHKIFVVTVRLGVVLRPSLKDDIFFSRKFPSGDSQFEANQFPSLIFFMPSLFKKFKLNVDTDTRMVITRGAKGGGGGGGRGQRVMSGAGRRLDLGGERTMPCADDAVQNCSSAPCVILLTTVTPIHSSNNLNEK